MKKFLLLLFFYYLFHLIHRHLFDTKVIAAAEFCIFTSDYYLHRKLNCDIGLSLWNI